MNYMTIRRNEEAAQREYTAGQAEIRNLLASARVLRANGEDDSELLDQVEAVFARIETVTQK